jgi:hypothetical protein
MLADLRPHLQELFVNNLRLLAIAIAGYPSFSSLGTLPAAGYDPREARLLTLKAVPAGFQ